MRERHRHPDLAQRLVQIVGTVPMVLAHPELFVDVTVARAQQAVMGRYKHWEQAYEKRCRKKKVKLTVLDGGKAA